MRRKGNRHQPGSALALFTPVGLLQIRFFFCSGWTSSWLGKRPTPAANFRGKCSQFNNSAGKNRPRICEAAESKGLTLCQTHFAELHPNIEPPAKKAEADASSVAPSSSKQCSRGSVIEKSPPPPESDQIRTLMMERPAVAAQPHKPPAKKACPSVDAKCKPAELDQISTLVMKRPAAAMQPDEPPASPSVDAKRKPAVNEPSRTACS